MIYVVISDIHANLEALTACFKIIDEIKPDRIICLGDLVDYCAQPNEIISIIKQRCDVIILGNHDEAQFVHSLSDSFTENARISSVHTRNIITKEHLQFFKTLLYTHSENDLFFVHASPHIPQSYKYVLNEESALMNFDAFTEKVCFIGHSHKPLIWEFDGVNVFSSSMENLDTGKRYIINVGSVGQPRDGNPEASFGYFDTELFVYKNIRVKYDIKSASDKIINAGLPEFLAQRLYKGV